MNVKALYDDILTVVQKHTAGLSPAEAQKAGSIIQQIINFVIQLLTVGNAELGPIKETQQIAIAGKTFTFDEDLTVKASS